MTRNERRAMRKNAFYTSKDLTKPLSKLTSSVNPDRITSIQSQMSTSNYTREGAGRQDQGFRNPWTGAAIFRLKSRTTRHTIPPSGLMR